MRSKSAKDIDPSGQVENWASISFVCLGGVGSSCEWELCDWENKETEGDKNGETHTHLLERDLLLKQSRDASDILNGEPPLIWFIIIIIFSSR